MADYDANTYPVDEILYNMSSAIANFDISTLRTVHFGQCVTMIPKWVSSESNDNLKIEMAWNKI